MSILIRAALLGGLAYVVSRAIKNSHDRPYSHDTRHLSQSEDSNQDELWPAAEQPSTGRI